jgi:hypothetical protein
MFTPIHGGKAFVWYSLLELAVDHPLIALSLLVFVGVPLVLGWMHEGRFFGECLIVGIRFFKHELFAWREFLNRLKRELTTGKSDP